MTGWAEGVMAEQNRKTENDKALRQEARRVVDRHLQMILSTTDDVAWEGSSVIGRLIEFCGDLPDSSGFAGVDKMPNRIQRIIDWPAKHRVSRRLMLQLTEGQRMALYIDRLYRGQHKADSDTARQTRQEVYWSDARCAEKLGISQNAFRLRISGGYQALEYMIAPAQGRPEAA